MLVLSFAVTQFIILWERSDYSILLKKNVNALTYTDFKFTNKDGFAIAASFWGANADEEDPEIGELKFVIKHWASAADSVSFTDLK